MGQILSQAEVDAILSSVEPSRPNSRPTPTADPTSRHEWECHDVGRIEPLQGNALKVVHALHDGICQRWTASLRTVFQSQVNVRAVGACQSTGAEFLRTLPSPDVICQIRHGHSAAESLLAWSDNLAHSLISKLLGGGNGSAAETATLTMTPIERRLLSRLNDAVLDELATLLDDTLTVAAVLPDLDAVSAQIANFPCVWFSFEISGFGTSGLIHLGIPLLCLNHTSESGTKSSPARADADFSTIPTGIQKVTVQVSATLASLTIKASDLLALQVGDIVMTDSSPVEPVLLRLNGRSLWQAAIGTHLGRKALRLTAPAVRSESQNPQANSQK
jgi:flagellar motor switch protein FliM